VTHPQRGKGGRKKRMGLAREVIELIEKYWSGEVTTKWHPPEGLFTKDAKTIAQALYRASRDLRQAMSRLNFYVNRAGKNLSPERKKTFEQVKELLRKLFGQKEQQ